MIFNDSARIRRKTKTVVHCKIIPPVLNFEKIKNCIINRRSRISGIVKFDRIISIFDSGLRKRDLTSIQIKIIKGIINNFIGI